MKIINIDTIMAEISQQYKCCTILNGKILNLKNIKLPAFNNINELKLFLNETFDLDLEFIKPKNIIFLSKKYSNIENDLPNITYEEIMLSVLNISRLYEKFFPTFTKDYNTNMTLKFANTITKEQGKAIETNNLHVSSLNPNQKRFLWDITVQVFLSKSAINFDREIYKILKRYHEKCIFSIEETDVAGSEYGFNFNNTNFIKIKIPKNSMKSFMALKNDAAYTSITMNESLSAIFQRLNLKTNQIELSESLKEKQYLLHGDKFAKPEDIVSVIRAKEDWRFSFKDQVPTLVQNSNIPISFDLSSINQVAISLLPKDFLNYLQIMQNTNKESLKKRIRIDMYNTISLFLNNYLSTHIIINKRYKLSELSPTAKTLFALKIIQVRCDSLCNVTSYTPSYISFFEDSTIGGGWRTENGKQVFDLTLSALDPIKRRGDRLSLTVGNEPIKK